MSLLLAFYIGGWIGASSVSILHDCDGTDRHMSKGECKVISVAAGAIWPAAVVQAVTK